MDKDTLRKRIDDVRFFLGQVEDIALNEGVTDEALGNADELVNAASHVRDELNGA